jgi:ribosomal protein L21E
MNNNHRRRPGIQPTSHACTTFVPGERVRIVKAPASYGYNGRTGIVIGVAGVQVSVMADTHPADIQCTTFYAEELEREVTL